MEPYTRRFDMPWDCDVPSFHAPLRTDVLLSEGVGSASFSRASGAVVTDFEGTIKPVRSGEVRFEGARRVENLNTVKSGSWTNGAANYNLVIRDSVEISPTGTTAKYLTTDGTNNIHNWYLFNDLGNTFAGNYYTLSIYAKAGAYDHLILQLSSVYNAFSNNSVNFNLTTGTFAITGASCSGYMKDCGNGWYRCCITDIALSNILQNANRPYLYLNSTTAYSDDGTKGIHIDGYQLERGAIVSEYVSTGVLLAPYHGCNVDGVKYFDYLNGNTISNGVLTESRGAPILDYPTTFTDFENRIVPTLSGETILQGARRVENILTHTDFISGWTTTTATITTGITDPLGGTTGARITANGTTSTIRQTPTIPINSGVITSVYIRRVSGTGSILLYNGLAAGVPYAVDLSPKLTSNYQRFTCGLVPNTTISTPYFWITLSVSGDVIEIAFPMYEVVTNQSNQNPSEYVSKGVLSYPYHGYNVDGVKYFRTYNGNTVSSNVVTEATGSAIPNIPYATIKGYYAEGARTNLALFSEQAQYGSKCTFTGAATGTFVAGETVNAQGGGTAVLVERNSSTVLYLKNQTGTFTGVLTGVTSGATGTILSTTPIWTPTDLTITPDTIISPMGTLTADTLTANTDNAVFQQTFTGTAASYSFSCYIKRKTGTGTISISCNGINFTNVTPSTDTWFKCYDVRTLTAATYNMSIKIGTSGDEIYFWQGQTELGGTGGSGVSTPTTPIITTTATATRAVDQLYYPSNGVFNLVAGTCYAEYYHPYNPDFSRIIGAGFTPLSTNTSALNSAYDGVNNYVAGSPVGNMTKGGTTWNLKGMRKTAFANGLSSSGPYSGNWYSPSSIYISYHGNSACNTTRNVLFWKKVQTDSELKALTKL